MRRLGMSTREWAVEKIVLSCARKLTNEAVGPRQIALFEVNAKIDCYHDGRFCELTNKSRIGQHDGLAN